MLDAIIDGQRELLGSVGHRLEHEVTDDPATHKRDETIAPPLIGRRVALGLLVADAEARAVESRRAAVGRQLGVEALQVWHVAWNDPAHADVIANHVLIIDGAADPAECRVSRPEGPSGTAQQQQPVSASGLADERYWSRWS